MGIDDGCDYPGLSDGEVNRIREEVRRSGYPLEQRVSHICHAALDGPTKHFPGAMSFREDGVYYSPDPVNQPLERIVLPFSKYPTWQMDNFSTNTQRTIYRETRQIDRHQAAVWREVDQVLSVRTTAMVCDEPVAAFLGVEAQALIECKHREKRLLVGIHDPQSSRSSSPIFSPLARTRLLNTVGHTILDPLHGLPRVTPLLLESRGETESKRDWRKNDEKLIYEATGSLYDYLIHQWQPWTETTIHPFLVESGIWSILAPQLDDPWFSLEHWIATELQPAWWEAFNIQHAQWHLIDPIQLALPILCVDMPLYQTTIDQDGQVQALVPIPAMVVEERMQDWPGRLTQVLYDAKPRYDSYRGAPVVVVHVDHLMPILIRVSEWINAWYAALEHHEHAPVLIQTWPLEVALWEAYYHHTRT